MAESQDRRIFFEMTNIESMDNNLELARLVERISAARVLVVGDVMLDRYWWGNASRLSPEAPVPVVALKTVSHLPGGAANVAANIAALGAEVVLVGVIGADEPARHLCESLGRNHIDDRSLVRFGTRPTTTKTRVLVHNHQIARVDEETDLPLTPEEEETVLRRVEAVIERADAVVLSDYAKGCLSHTIVAGVIEQARRHEKIVIVDPKSRDLTKYSRADFLTPNLSEALQAAGIDHGGEEMVEAAAAKILAETAVKYLLITLGEHGMRLFTKDAEPVHFPSMARQVFDVTGAGDTVVAFLAAALAAGSGIPAAIELANIAAGLAVESVGTAIVSLDDLLDAIRKRAERNA